jgi:hypothetical protein
MTEIIKAKLRAIDGMKDPNDFELAGKLDEAIAEAVAEAEQARPAAFTMVGELVANPKPPNWLVRGFLEADSLALLYGPPKKGKSFCAIDLACSVATGTPWHGCKTKQAPVFYLAGEGHNGLARRFSAWSIARGVDLTNAPLAVSNRPRPMTDPDAAQSVSDAVAQLADQVGAQPGLIVVDTLARNYGGNENDSQDMGRFIAHLDAIRDTYNATVLVVHHSGKDEQRGARGSTALFGAIDAAYSVTQDESRTVTLTPEAMKDATLPPAMAFDLSIVELDIEDEPGQPATSCCPALLSGDFQPKRKQLSDDQKRLLGFIWEVLKRDKDLPPTSVLAAPRPPKPGQTALSRPVLKAHVEQSGGLGSGTSRDSRKRAFNRTLLKLQDYGEIEIFEDWIWLRDKRDKPGQTGFVPPGQGEGSRDNRDTPL